MTVDDCDDNDALTIYDMDCDGIETSIDCDDNDSTDFLFIGDCDQDGVPAVDDCDDYNPNASDNSVGVDEDCDGVVTTDDCNDTDPTKSYLISKDIGGFEYIYEKAHINAYNKQGRHLFHLWVAIFGL